MEISSAAQAADKNAQLIFRDYHLGLLAQVTEFRERARIAESRLEAEMTRAYVAEGTVLELQQKLHEIARLRRQLDDINNSATWRVGRFLMTPVRQLRRLLGR